MALPNYTNLNLKQMRQLFRQLSGRYDLVTADYADNGFDFLANAAIRMLDRMPTPLNWKRRHYVNLAIGQYKVTVSNCKAVSNVFISDEDNSFALNRKDLDYMRENYPDIFVDSVSSSNTFGDYSITTQVGTPCIFALGVEGLSPQLNDESSMDFYYGAKDATRGSYYGNRVILIAPAPETAMTLGIEGYFRSKHLQADTDKNFWTVVAPEILLKAINYQIESLYHQNDTRTRAWMQDLMQEINSFSYDFTLDQQYVKEKEDIQEDE